MSKKTSIAMSDRHTVPKETAVSADHSFLRRLPSFATILGSSKGLHASEHARNEQSTVNSDLRLNPRTPTSKETVLLETAECIVSNEKLERKRDRLSEALEDLILIAHTDNDGETNRSTDTPSEPTDAPKLPELSQNCQEERPENFTTHSQRPRCQSQPFSSGSEILIIPETPDAANTIPGHQDMRSGDSEPTRHLSRAATPNLMVGLTLAGQPSPRALFSESGSTNHDAFSARALKKYTNSPTSLPDGDIQQTSHDDEVTSKHLLEKGFGGSTRPIDAAHTPTDRHESDKTQVNKETTGWRHLEEVAVLSKCFLSHKSIHDTDGRVPIVGSPPIRRDDTSSMSTGIGAGGELALKSVVEESWPPQCDNTQLPYEGRSGSASVARTASELQHGKKFTNRERAQMALVAARGKRLTIAEIVDWNMQMFSHLREKKTVLERNIGAALSAFSEFDGKKVAEARGRKQVWGFTNTSWRDKYEREYAEYCIPLDNLTLRYHGTSSQTFTVADNVLTDTTATPTEPWSTRGVALPAGPKGCEISFWKPPGVYSSPQMLKLNDSSRGKFFEELPTGQTSLGETMAQVDIDQRILEIKQRPSRKRFFGSDHRLAHVRRYGRQDIHDESEAAWKPGPYKKVKRTRLDISSTIDGLERGERVKTVKQLFNLPENAIPMNAGQAELAFRDGTLVSTLLLKSLLDTPD